jgi:beta-galactosidase/beta-glucuronidase
MLLDSGKNSLKTSVDIPNQKLWSPKSPHLYSIDISLANGKETTDNWTHRFGMRKFTIKNNQFYLNNEPLYLKATFFEGLYPVGLAYPDSKEMAIREIQLAKDAGFNMIRPWRKPPPKMWLDLCDEMGVLTVGSLAIECMNRPIQSAYLPMRVENELTQSILRDRNRTSVVIWELFNELLQPVMIQMLQPMSLKARELDPTRLISR